MMTCEVCSRRSTSVVRLSSGLRIHPECFWSNGTGLYYAVQLHYGGNRGRNPR